MIAKGFIAKGIAAAVVLGLTAGVALAAGQCAAGKTITPGKLTVATGNPAYSPWVENDDPASGKGFEAAVAYAVAKAMGFSHDEVTWVRAGFDESIQPGAKSFDFNLQQFSITPEREKVVAFSHPYYTAAMAVLVRKSAVEAGAKPTIASLKKLKWGIVASTTALPVVEKMIAPDSKPLLYDDNANVVAAMKANQIDAAIFDLPTALYLAAVELDDGVVLGQFPADRSEHPDQFGLLLEKGNPLLACVNEAMDKITKDGELASIEKTWLQDATGVPLIK